MVNTESRLVPGITASMVGDCIVIVDSGGHLGGLL